jgi:hypothetical protein
MTSEATTMTSEATTMTSEATTMTSTATTMESSCRHRRRGERAAQRRGDCRNGNCLFQ